MPELVITVDDAKGAIAVHLSGIKQRCPTVLNKVEQVWKVGPHNFLCCLFSGRSVVKVCRRTLNWMLAARVARGTKLRCLRLAFKVKRLSLSKLLCNCLCME